MIVRVRVLIWAKTSSMHEVVGIDRDDEHQRGQGKLEKERKSSLWFNQVCQR